MMGEYLTFSHDPQNRNYLQKRTCITFMSFRKSNNPMLFNINLYFRAPVNEKSLQILGFNA